MNNLPRALLLRPATPADRPQMLALQWKASLANPQDREALLAHPDAIEIPDEHLLPGRAVAAMAGGSMAGFAIVLPREDGDAELDGLFVDPALWRRGIGRRLTVEACAMARAMGAASIHVVAGTAEPFYHRLGFETLGEVPTRFAMARSMRLPLAGS